MPSTLPPSTDNQVRPAATTDTTGRTIHTMPTWYIVACTLAPAPAIWWALRHAGLGHDTTSRLWREHRTSGRTPHR